jgi:hypothetical protein
LDAKKEEITLGYYNNLTYIYNMAQKQKTLAALAQIQRELKVGKKKFNEFGKFNYRSAEDILEALKPYLTVHQAYLLMTDEVVSIGDSIFVKAVVSFGMINVDEGSICAHGYAKHPEALKGMVDTQITGSASSYARKYALAGLLMLDDAKDADDANKNGAQKPEMTPKHELWGKARSKYLSGKLTMESLRKSYQLSEENEILLTKP